MWCCSSASILNAGACAALSSLLSAGLPPWPVGVVLCWSAAAACGGLACGCAACVCADMTYFAQIAQRDSKRRGCGGVSTRSIKPGWSKSPCAARRRTAAQNLNFLCVVWWCGDAGGVEACALGALCSPPVVRRRGTTTRPATCLPAMHAPHLHAHKHPQPTSIADATPPGPFAAAPAPAGAHRALARECAPPVDHLPRAAPPCACPPAPPPRAPKPSKQRARRDARPPCSALVGRVQAHADVPRVAYLAHWPPAPRLSPCTF